MAAKVKALQQWCKVQCDGYRDVNIVNMTSSWKSGLAFCAMIHRYRPDLIVYDMIERLDLFAWITTHSITKEIMDSQAIKHKAFQSASQLGIAALLDPEDMVVMTVPDKLCIITYVSQYYNVLSKLRPAAGGGTMAVKRSAASDDHPSVEKKKPVLENSNKHNQTSSYESSKKDPDTSAKVRTMDDRCSVCGNKVFIVERHMENNKLYHRKCLRDLQKSQSSTLRASQEGVLAMDVTNYDDNVNTREESLKDTSRTLPINQDSKSSDQNLPPSQDQKFSDHKLATIKEPMSTETTSSKSSPSKSTNQTPQRGPENTRTVDQVLPKRQEHSPSVQQNITVETPNCQKATERQNSRLSVQKIQTNQNAVFSNKIPQNNQHDRIPDQTLSKRQDTKTATTSSNNIVASYSKQSQDSKIESGQSSSSSSANSTPSGTLTRSNSHNSENKNGHSSNINVPNSRPVSMCVTQTFQISNKNTANDSSKNTSIKASAKDLVVNRSDPNQAEGIRNPDRSVVPSGVQAVRESEKVKSVQIPQNDIVAKESLSQPVMRSTNNRVSVVSTPEAHVAKSNDSSGISQMPPSKQTSRASWSPAVQTKKFEDGKISLVEKTLDKPASNDDTVPQTICVGKNGDVPISSTNQKHPESSMCSNVGGTVQPEFVNSNIQPSKRVHPPPNNDGNPPNKFPRETSSGTSGFHPSKVPEKQSVKQPTNDVQERNMEQSVRPPSSAVQGNQLVARPRSHHPTKNREITQHQRSDIQNKESNNPADNIQLPETQSPVTPSRSNTELTVQPTFRETQSVPHEPELPAKSVFRNPSAETSGTPTHRTGEPGLVCSTPTKELTIQTADSKRLSKVDTQIIQDQVPKPDQSGLNNRVSGASEKSQIDPKSDETTSLKVENRRANGSGFPTSDQSINTKISTPVSISNDDNTSVKKHPKGTAPPPPSIQTQQLKDTTSASATISNQPQQSKINTPATPLSNHPQSPKISKPPATTVPNQTQSPRNSIPAIHAVESHPNQPQSPRNLTPAVTVTAGVTSISSQPKQPQISTPSTPLSPTPPQRPKDRTSIAPSIPIRPTPGQLAPASTPKTPTSPPECTISLAPASEPKTPTSPPGCTVSNVPIPTPRDLKKTPQNPTTVATEKVPSHSDRQTNDLAVTNDVIKRPQDGVSSTVCPNDKLTTPVPSPRNAKTKMANNNNGTESEKENKQKITDNKESEQDRTILTPARPPPPAHPPNRLASPSSSFNSNDKPVISKSNSRSSTSDELLSPPPKPKPPNPENVEKCKRKITPDVKFTFDDEKLTFPCAVARSASRTTKGLEPSAINQPVVRRKVVGEDRLDNEYIVQQLNFIDMRLKEMEKEGRLLEEKIRSSSDDSMDDDVDLMVLWFDMINCRNELVREESDLIYRCRQQELEDTHSNVEYELRRLMAKPDHLKTDADRKKEEELLKKLLETVSMRSSIVDCMEEDRLRYLKEDEELAKTKSAKVLTTGSDTKRPEKKKNVFYNNDQMLY